MNKKQRIDLGVARELLLNHRPRRKRHRLGRSAVALILSQPIGGELQVLMIRRAERDGDPWSGHMAFPGGHSDPTDSNTLATAKRETLEEVGFDVGANGDYLGQLSDIETRPRIKGRQMVISPFVFALDKDPELCCNDEVDETHWIPLSFLADRQNRQKMQWKTQGTRIDLPCYLYNGRRVWGLSLTMLDELVDILFWS